MLDIGGTGVRFLGDFLRRAKIFISRISRIGAAMAFMKRNRDRLGFRKGFIRRQVWGEDLLPG